MIDRLRVPLLLLFFISFPLPVAFQQAILGALFAVMTLQCWQTGELPTTPLDRPLLVFFGAMLLSTVFCPAVLNSLAGYRKLWLVSAFFVTATLVREPKEAERLLALLVISASVVAVYGIVQHYTGI